MKTTLLCWIPWQLPWLWACLGCSPQAAPECNAGEVCLSNWAKDAAPLPFADTPDAQSCRVQLSFDPADLPPELPAPAFEAQPQLEAALNSLAPGDCEGQQVLAYALPADYDADGDQDLVIRRPVGPDAGGGECEQIAVGVVRNEGGQLGAFEALPALQHFYIVGSLNGDQYPDAVTIGGGCARALPYREDVGFAHDQSLALACDEGIGNDDNTVTTWDLDRDGDLDLLLATGELNFYFRNDSDGATLVLSEAIAEAGLTPAGAYDYDPNDPKLSQGGEPFDPTRAQSFYIYCDHEDPFDPLSPTICQVDNDGTTSFNESYRCDAKGRCAWVDDRVDPACDRITVSMYSRYLCDADISDSQYDNLVTTAAELLGQTAEQATHIAHSSGSPATGDNTNPMSIARFGVWPYAFEYKGQAEGVVADTVVVYERERGWLQFEPYHLDNGHSSGGYEQQSWGSLALEDGSGWPVLVGVRGFDGEPGQTAASARPLLEQLLETSLPCLEQTPGATFGLADVGVSVVGPDGRLETLGEIVVDEAGARSTGPIAELGVYKTVTPAWLGSELNLILGGFDGLLRAYRVVEQGALLRLVLDPGPGRAPHGYGAVLFVEIGERLRGPKTVGADGVSPHTGNHRHSWDFGLGEATTATVYVLWPWGETERFADVQADATAKTLVYGAGELDPELPEALAAVLTGG